MQQPWGSLLDAVQPASHGYYLLSQQNSKEQAKDYQQKISTNKQDSEKIFIGFLHISISSTDFDTS